jgi:hypothetical protein
MEKKEGGGGWRELGAWEGVPSERECSRRAMERGDEEGATSLAARRCSRLVLPDP